MKLSDHISGIKPVLAVLLTGCMALLAGACSDDGPQDGPTPEGDLMISFTLNVGDNSPVNELSRTPSGDYNRGEGYENYIALSDLDFHFYLFGDDKVFMTELKVGGIVALESTGESSKRYSVICIVPGIDLSRRSFKIVAAANWKHKYPSLTAGVSTIDDLAAAVYDFSAPFMPTADTPIPLFGVKSYPSMTFNANNYGDGGILHLLRAMAKVEVICETPNWSLQEVTMTRYNKAGHQAPMNVYDEADYVHNSWNDDYVPYLSIPAGTEQATDLLFKETPLPNGKSIFTVYVPEYINVDAGGNALAERAQIDVKFHESPKHYTLEFDVYEDGKPTGKPFNIHRNYFYRYSITKHDEWSDINVKLDIEPYSKVELTPDMGLDRDEKGRIIYYRDRTTLYLLDVETGRCFTENAAGEMTYVTSIYDSNLGQYIYQYVEGYNYYWDRGAWRWYFRCENDEMFYVSFTFNGSDYYYDPVRHQCYSFDNGVREYIDEVVDNENGTVLYHYHAGISYFYDPETKEYYYRTGYGDRVNISMTVGGVHYLYDLSKKMFYIEGTSTYVSEITDPETGKVVYRHYPDLNKSFFLDSATDEYYYRNPLGERVFVTMTVNDTRYYDSLDRHRFYHYAPDKIFVDIITDTNAGRIMYRYVHGIAYFWDSRRQKYYYRDTDDDIAVYVDNLPNN